MDWHLLLLELSIRCPTCILASGADPCLRSYHILRFLSYCRAQVELRHYQEALAAIEAKREVRNFEAAAEFCGVCLKPLAWACVGCHMPTCETKHGAVSSFGEGAEYGATTVQCMP